MKLNLRDLDLDPADRCAARRQYRILRIAIYAPDGAQGDRFHGYYGLSRDDARAKLADFYLDISWYTYLASK